MIISNVEISCLNEDNKNGFYVYGIRNKITNKYYIGSTVSKYGIKFRLRRHIYHLNRNDHHSEKLQRSFNKYDRNFNNWEFIILDNIDKSTQQSKEQFYINKYNSYYNGYNSTKESNKIFSGKMNEEHKKSISDSKQILKKEQIIDIFKKFNNGMNYIEVSKYYNLSYVTISSIINNKKYYTDIKEKFNLSKNFYKYIFYNLKENKFYRTNNFSKFCREKKLKDKNMMALYCGKFKKTFINDWTIFNRENFSLKNLRDRIKKNETKKFVLYKDNIKIEFQNVVDFCKERNLDNSTIYNVINGKIKEYKGYSNEDNR